MKFGTGQRASLDGGKEGRYKPGPGAHSAKPEHVLYCAPKFGFGTELRDEISKLAPKTPGPGSYMARTFTGFENPKFSMGQQLQWQPHKKEQAHKPGPGSYSPINKTIRKKDAAWKIGSEVRRDLKFEKAQGFQTAPG